MKKYFVCKYIAFGWYSDWKEVSKEVAERKAEVLVRRNGCYYRPYKVKVVEG